MKEQGGQQPAGRPGPANQGVPQPARPGPPPSPQGNQPPQKGGSLLSYAGSAPSAEPAAPKGTPLTQRYQQGQQPANNAAVPNTPPPAKNVAQMSPTPGRPPMAPPMGAHPAQPPTNNVAQMSPTPGRSPMAPPMGAHPAQPPMPNNPGRSQDQVVRTSTPPSPNHQPANPGNQVARPQPHNVLREGISLDDLYNDPAMRITSQAAERWRASWRGRQKAEAGPAVGIARGQAEVPEPLFAMQYSIARMRAVINTGKKPKADTSKGIAFWGPVLVMSLLIIGLVAYSATTLVGSGTTPTLAAIGSYPLVEIKAATTTFTAGQLIHVVGTRFSHNGTVVLSLESGSSRGQTQSVISDKYGNIDSTLSVPANALAGNYTLKAVDDTTKGSSFLPVHVLPANTANTTPLEATGADQLSFTTTQANPTPKGQKVTLTNPTATPVSWSATSFSNYTSTDPKKPINTDAMGWLLLSDGHTSGQLDPQGTDTLSVSVNAMGLTPSLDHPYVGYIVINTLNAQNQQGQMLLKVSLLLKPNGNELVITPSTTLVVTRDPDGTCTQHPPSITIANLGIAPVNYTVKTADGNTANFFNLSQNATGMVNPIGGATTDATGKSIPTDIQAITLTCHNIQAGVTSYHINVYPGTSPVVVLNIAVVAG